MEPFSAEWAAALERELAVDDEDARAAGRWRASLLFVQDAEGREATERSVFLDLAHGSRRAVRQALPDDHRRAHLAVAAPPRVWRRVISGDLDPASAFVGGELRLLRGSLFALLPHLGAARALLACARRIPTPLEPLGR